MFYKNQEIQFKITWKGKTEHITKLNLPFAQNILQKPRNPI